MVAGAINLLGARLTSQRPADKQWTTQFTAVQLKFSFLAEPSSSSDWEPLTIGRTFITFYDFDQGEPTFSGSYTQREAMQLDNQALVTLTTPSTELITYCALLCARKHSSGCT